MAGDGEARGGGGGGLEYRPFYSYLLPFAFFSVMTSFQENLGCVESVWKGSFALGVVKLVWSNDSRMKK